MGHPTILTAYFPSSNSGVRFVAVELAEANDLTVVAQAEREAISWRTKEALAVAKARGVKLGNPNGAASLRRTGKRHYGAESGGIGQCSKVCSWPRAGAQRHPGRGAHLATCHRCGADGARDQDKAGRSVGGGECQASHVPKSWARCAVSYGL